tara:strand:- start:1178 stop:1813 length:636 start_codon:yes stop_codon:yes gene_type:complete
MSSYQEAAASVFLQFITVFYVFLYGTAISFYIVSFCYDKDIFNRPKIEYKDRDYYEHEYKEEFDNLETRELSDDFLKSLLEKTILEKTPKGEILMFYNSEYECFWYYFTGIPGVPSCPYNYLESAARAYVLKYDCKNIFKEKYRKVEQANTATQNLDKVFANLKTMSEEKVVYYACRFICKGKIADYKENGVEVEKAFYDINFATFKAKQS